jgi:hypothetical protein
MALYGDGRGEPQSPNTKKNTPRDWFRNWAGRVRPRRLSNSDLEHQNF